MKSRRFIASKGWVKAPCEIVKIPLEHTIAVGDSDNDVKMMKVAGLPVAMGNARECVREVCKVNVADNDHGGCAEAIYRYLLVDRMNRQHGMTE